MADVCFAAREGELAFLQRARHKNKDKQSRSSLGRRNRKPQTLEKLAEKEREKLTFVVQCARERIGVSAAQETKTKTKPSRMLAGHRSQNVEILHDLIHSINSTHTP